MININPLTQEQRNVAINLLFELVKLVSGGLQFNAIT